LRWLSCSASRDTAAAGCCRNAFGARTIFYYGLRDYAGALAGVKCAASLTQYPRLFELTGYILRRRGQQEEGPQNLSARWSWIRGTFTLQQIALSYQDAALHEATLRWIAR
jgi:hypothetical protein